VYVIESNPRASRTVPFVSKAVGVPLAKLACRLLLGERIGDLGPELEPLSRGGGHVSVKEAVLPFDRFPRADALLGPEMRSTGEVMGIARDFPTAFGKAEAAAGARLPTSGRVFISVTDGDKASATQLAASLHDLGFGILATGGTARDPGGPPGAARRPRAPGAARGGRASHSRPPHRQGAGVTSATAEPRTLAPPGRRVAEVTANREVGAYRLISAHDGGGPPDP